MRVLIDGSQALNRSGTGRYVSELIPALLQTAEDLFLDVLWPDSPESAPAPYRLRVIPIQNRLRNRLFDHAPRGTGLEHATPDLHHYPANFAPLFGGRDAVLTVHDLSFLRHPEWFRRERAAYYRWAIRRSTAAANRIIADSQATADDLVSLLGVPATRIDVIPLGVGTEFRIQTEDACARVRSALGLPKRFFLYAGTLEPRKNLPRVIDAFSQIAGSVDLDLVIAGRKGWKTHALDAAIRQSRAAQRIHFPGYVAPEDLPALIGAATAFVWPSLFEGFGLPPLEAMACGTPVITSTTSSLPEVVGPAALTIDPGDTPAIAEAMRALAENAALREELRTKGLRRAAEFTWQRTARLTLDTYRKAARKG